MLSKITPIVPVADIERSVRFYHDFLGFTVGLQQDDYAYIHRDEVAIRLLRAAPDVDTRAPERQISCYIDVQGVDRLYARLKPMLDRLPPGRVRAPFDQAYGQREFHVIDEDALLLFFGEPIE